MRHLRLLGALLLVLALVVVLAVNLTPSTAPEAMLELGIVEAVDLTVPAYVADIMPEADVGSAEVADTIVALLVTMAALALVIVALYSFLKQRAPWTSSASGTFDGGRRPRDCIQCEPSGA